MKTLAESIIASLIYTNAVYSHAAGAEARRSGSGRVGRRAAYHRGKRSLHMTSQAISTFRAGALRRLGCLAVCVMAAGALAEASAQGAAKTLRYAFPVAETGFDPGQINDLYSSIILGQIFDPPYTYDFLSRPVKVRTNTAVGMPEVSADGLTWTVRIQPGIFFTEDPAFNGRKRELVAQDYVYSLKRHFDPKVKSPNLYLVHKLIAGMDAVRQAALKGEKFDYDREVEGIRAVDRYTYRIRLTEPAPNLLYYLTYCNLMCAVAREVIEAAGDKAMERPVGTNAFKIAQWKR
ncbi:MAG: ABC transporter substrate-binding protein, partial [Terriglobales bacterium]